MLDREPSRRLLSRAGLIGLVTGLLGGLGSVVLLVWPPQIAKGPLSYPFTTTGFLIAQGALFVHHIGLVILVGGFAVSGAAGFGGGSSALP